MTARRRLGILAILAALLSPISSPVRAEQRSLRPIYDYVIEVSGVADKGWTVLAPPQQKTQLLLVSPPGDQALLVSVSDKAVRPVDRGLLLKHPDGTIDILAGAVSATKIIPLVVSGATASFSVDGRELALKPRPPLLGPHTLEDLVEDRPNFGDGIKSYKPDTEAVSYLKKYPKPTEIEVFFGSWCSVCEAWVPKLLKSLQLAGNTKIQFTLIGVSRDFSSDLQIARQKGIRGLPTLIIRQDGIEIGRLVGAPEKGTVEAALADLLRARIARKPPLPGPRTVTGLVGDRRELGESAEVGPIAGPPAGAMEAALAGTPKTHA